MPHGLAVNRERGGEKGPAFPRVLSSSALLGGRLLGKRLCNPYAPPTLTQPVQRKGLCLSHLCKSQQMHLQLPNLLMCEPFREWELSQAQAPDIVPVTVARAWRELRAELGDGSLRRCSAAVLPAPVAVLLAHMKLQPPLAVKSNTWW